MNKIDFVLLVTATNCNPNGDPLNGNFPRISDGYGEISDVCIKRKIRNRMQDMGKAIFMQSDDRKTDNFKSLKERFDVFRNGIKEDISKRKEQGVKMSENEMVAEAACSEWLDVRSFGQVFAFKSNAKDTQGVSIGVRGPVSIHQAVSCSPIDVNSMQIVKSVSGETKTDTMGMKHLVEFGLYEIKGSINAQLAEKTGFTDKDADIVKECLRSLFENDASAARPDGSMEVCRLYWWDHGCKNGKYSSAKVHRSVHVKLKDGVETPRSIDDYDITLEKLDDLDPEVIDGI